MSRIGVMTSGADSPGLNAAIRAVVRRATHAYGMEVIGILRGWLGLTDNLHESLDDAHVADIITRGGTILRTSRTNPFRHPGATKLMEENVRKLGLRGLIVFGGATALSVAARLYRELRLPIVGVPKTIDNDVEGTDFCFGFDTCVNVAADAIDRIHTTAESHDRVMVVEVMGHHAGWIALYAGLAGGADLILIPEHPANVNEVCDKIVGIHELGRDFSIVVVAEGARLISPEYPEGRRIYQDSAHDEFDDIRLGGVGLVLAREIEDRTGYETRVTTLGYVQRGGAPSAFDRVLATRFGIAAVDLVQKGSFGRMVSLQGNHVTDVDLALAGLDIKTVPEELYEAARAVFG